MSAGRLDRLVHDARAQGLLPDDAKTPVSDTRPWPVVLLTALGAWLATLPLLGVVGILLGDVIHRGVGPYVVGMLLLAAAIVVLRSRDVPLFVEQLAVPALLVGGGSLGFGLFRDAGNGGGGLLLAGVALAVAVALRASWLRVLLGAVAALLLAIALAQGPWRGGRGDAARDLWWLCWHLLLVAWLGAHALGRRGLRGHAAAALESIGAGWGLALLAAFAIWSGLTFLVGGTFGGGWGGELAGEWNRHGGIWVWRGLQGVSALLALAGAAVAARRWPGLRHPALAVAAAVGAALAALMPSLGATLLMFALLATSGRWRLAAGAGFAAAWITGAFYYQLAWPLAHKAAWLAGAGAALGAMAWWLAGGPGVRTSRTPVAAPVPRFSRAGIALALVAVLAAANLAIRDKEVLIREGRAVFVELAPADPRSLMQGDFMRLNFRVPGEPAARHAGLLTAQRPQVVAQVDERGVARLVRIDAGEPLQPGELRIELTPKDGRWTLVTDAWFFAEGEAERWARARYGEFRVDANGRALLVGLRSAQLEAL